MNAALVGLLTKAAFMHHADTGDIKGLEMAQCRVVEAATVQYTPPCHTLAGEEEGKGRPPDREWHWEGAVRKRGAARDGLNSDYHTRLRLKRPQHTAS